MHGLHPGARLPAHEGLQAGLHQIGGVRTRGIALGDLLHVAHRHYHQPAAGDACGFAVCRHLQHPVAIGDNEGSRQALATHVLDSKRHRAMHPGERRHGVDEALADEWLQVEHHDP